ncbi:probable WRKY transcription factor 53 [Rhodamnia argentea]|uniref:Probable WRKY transcription factor 53 n=1 Tax=Rhodamnia argentea TaxID=178133 RepID=A0A8B8Q3F3_9MYRT|nr:probable WRKY transcription factor 53 [Rhodamnia argentea]
MERVINWEQHNLINELAQGKELAKQLRSHLVSPSSSRETREYLVEKILSCYQKSLAMLNCDAFMMEEHKPAFSIGTSGSPKNEGDVYKKRKTMPRWTEQVRVNSDTALEGHPEDGFSWRKYGQKEILGANFPRGYYRCSRRHVQGCLATKQVQRSDQDPAVVEVTYRGRHTCIQSPSSAISPAPAVKEEPQKETRNREEQPKPSRETLLSSKWGLSVKTENLDARHKDVFPLFTFSTAEAEPENGEGNYFVDALMDDNFMDRFSSPATSGSNYFSLSLDHMTNFCAPNNVQTSDSGLTEIVSAPTSVTNSPMGDASFSLSKVDFDLDFPFNPDFF